ncbi:N utilization substance protein B [Breznakia sp. PF5-3]|uniref:transcription antitermination factor NusB n=1 Tax=unclassified Breznakia TaxID=2623764 RepID=UPI002404FDDC|nr:MULTISPECIES: transcription antitermination factor NusB [unclassified Breznakia]MDL2276469.1 transcription antitermination factor NusB [Breznakia sp. OttesenSCG-928-G09]MDF9823908.1 N utilization substance protein B [Breznakia sp. PM6-1]MDF9834707.1 N utilization substance protein B [Breznakia sp. PF5-3]MDF9836858.1 N utilization substance protein B [Breznakia sp. PFB2-8]MDF9858875.1 N utilization substance protein B [Breznakia sp. PH5-24]
MNRHETRELAMTSLYQSFLLDKDIKRILLENEKIGNDISPFLYTITIDASSNLDVYKERIDRVLKGDWTFERLGYIEQAILTIALCELDFETAQRQIVIDEAIVLAKKYCDDDTYKLINGVLDKL